MSGASHCPDIALAKRGLDAASAKSGLCGCGGSICGAREIGI
jgi:hypothetical protein